MRTEMIIRVTASSDKGHCKAIKVAAAIRGVESVAIAGEDKSLLLVIGVGIDSNRITEKLRRKVGHAEVVELHTVDAAGDELMGGGGGGLAAEHAYRYYQSPAHYKHAAARDHYYGAGVGVYPRDHYYSAGAGAGAYPRDPYYYGGPGGGYPAQYDYYSGQYPAAGNSHTVVHHTYPSDDPNSCSVM